jgi:glutaredoxin
MKFLLYTRRGCHLCEAAEDMLAAAGVPVERVDVDADRAAAARFGLRVPVLEAAGRVLMEGRFDPTLVANLPSEAEIQAAPGEGVGEAGG